jgi:hypothetical protein
MQIKLSFASESHVPRFRAGVGTWRSGYMIPIRLPWRHRARPSATLHEIPSLPRRANLSLILQRQLRFVNKIVDRIVDRNDRPNRPCSPEKFVLSAGDRYTLDSRGDYGEVEKVFFSSAR